MLNARYGQRNRVLHVVQIEARCAERDRVLNVIQIEAPCAGVIPFWCGRRMRLADGNGEPAAEHAHAADRCARDRSLFGSYCDALAAADGHSVRPLSLALCDWR